MWTIVRLVGEQLQRLGDRRRQHLGDVLALPRHAQRRVVEALALAHLAGDVHVGEEVHLDLAHAVALARLAAPAVHVEREARRRVAVGPRLLRAGEQLADRDRTPWCRSPGSSAACARSGSDRCRSPCRSARRRGATCACRPAQLRVVQRAAQRRVQDLVDQRRLAGARHAGHRAQDAEREARVDVAQVVLARALDLDEAGRRAAASPAPRSRRAPTGSARSATSGSSRSSAGVPAATTLPPCRPAPGPKSST